MYGVCQPTAQLLISYLSFIIDRQPHATNPLIHIIEMPRCVVCGGILTVHLCMPPGRMRRVACCSRGLLARTALQHLDCVHDGGSVVVPLLWA